MLGALAAGIGRGSLGFSDALANVATQRQRKSEFDSRRQTAEVDAMRQYMLAKERAARDEQRIALQESAQALTRQRLEWDKEKAEAALERSRNELALRRRHQTFEDNVRAQDYRDQGYTSARVIQGPAGSSVYRGAKTEDAKNTDESRHALRSVREVQEALQKRAEDREDELGPSGPLPPYTAAEQAAFADSLSATLGPWPDYPALQAASQRLNPETMPWAAILRNAEMARLRGDAIMQGSAGLPPVSASGWGSSQLQRGNPATTTAADDVDPNDPLGLRPLVSRR